MSTRTNTLELLPPYWQREIKNLRAENARYRRERNGLRAELAELKSQTDDRVK